MIYSNAMSPSRKAWISKPAAKMEITNLPLSCAESVFSTVFSVAAAVCTDHRLAYDVLPPGAAVRSLVDDWRVSLQLMHSAASSTPMGLRGGAPPVVLANHGSSTTIRCMRRTQPRSSSCKGRRKVNFLFHECCATREREREFI